MKRLVILATAAVFLVTLAVAGPATADGGRHGGGGFFFGSAGFSGYPAYGGPSFFVGSASPGFSFFIGSGPSYGYGRHGYGRHYRGRDGYERHRYGRREYRRYDRDRYYDRPYRRHGRHRGYSRGYGGIRKQGFSPGYIRPVVPQGRFWVPGRATPRGYARGHWDHR